jgi:hypothetical protein
MKKTRKKIEVYDSLKHAAGAMGIPSELLQEAKGLGCPGFRGSRIYAAEVRAWLSENPVDRAGGDGDSLVGLRKKFLRSQIRRADFQLETLKGLHMPISEVVSTITVLVSELNGLIRGVENDIPGTIQGLDIPSARLVIQKRFDEMRQKINAPLVEYRRAQAQVQEAA